MAPGTGFEPATKWLHVFPYFRLGVDYIIPAGRGEALRPIALGDRTTPGRDSL